MPRCQLDETIKRVVTGGTAFPLGVYPVEPCEPRQGYAVEFEPADGDGGGGDAGEWEEWPDRYVFDVVITAERLVSLTRVLVAMLPGRIFPILDVMGHDAYREIDPYISYELLGTDRFLDTLRRYAEFFFEDGLVGFGAMCDEPFFYMFVDEHKIVTIRVPAEERERVERALQAFGLEQIAEPAGADSAAHEHRSVLLAPEDDPDTLTVDEIVEALRDEWQLVLNIDPESNLDDGGQELGTAQWRCLVRVHADTPATRNTSLGTGGSNSDGSVRYSEVFLEASCLREAEDLACDAVTTLGPAADFAPDFSLGDAVVVQADRMSPEQFRDGIRLASRVPGGIESSEEPVRLLRWFE